MKRSIKILYALLFFAANFSAFGQTDKMNSQIDSLKYIKGDAHDCSSLIWKIAAYEKDAIQILIDKLDDTTTTRATDVCKKNYLRVGDLAYISLGEILPLPFFAVTNMQMDVIDDNGCQQGVFNYIESNRKKFKQQVQAYYDHNKSRMKWNESEDFMLLPCQVENGLHGHYYVPE